jgi:NTE family protein
MSLLTDEPRGHTAQAQTAVELMVLYRKDFEALVRDVPGLAIPIARTLSVRLLEESKKATAASTSVSRLYALASTLSRGDRVVFTINLAIALTEQTRRRVLVLDLLDEESGLFTKALGRAPLSVDEKSFQSEELENPAVLSRFTVLHPSGLELLSLPLPLLEGSLAGRLYPFIEKLRLNYDVILAVLPPQPTVAAQRVLEESDRFLFLEERGRPEGFTPWANFLPLEKTLRIQLGEIAHPLLGLSPVFPLIWSKALGDSYLRQGSPFLPMTSRETHRLMDRLARQLGGRRIGLAMGSGAALGYSIIGMLRVMEAHGIYPDIISGTSIGALLGSFYAAGQSPDELEQIALSITKPKLWSLADFTFPWQGVILGRQVLKFLKSILGDRDFKDLSLPFACVATDIMTGEEVVLREGPVAEAVRGSLSLPFFFQPYFHQGRFLVDGGLVNPVPTSVLKDMGADSLFSVNLTVPPSTKRFIHTKDRSHQSLRHFKGPHIFQVMLKTTYTMQYRIAQTRAELSDLVFNPDLSQFAWADFHRAADIIHCGEIYMEEVISKMKTFIPFFANACQVSLRCSAPLTRS